MFHFTLSFLYDYKAVKTVALNCVSFLFIDDKYFHDVFIKMALEPFFFFDSQLTIWSPLAD